LLRQLKLNGEKIQVFISSALRHDAGVKKAIKSQDIGNKGVIAMDMILSRASVPSFGREATPELKRRPFDQDLWARLETIEIDPPDEVPIQNPSTCRPEDAANSILSIRRRTLDGFWRFLRIVILMVKLRYFAISGGLSSSELCRRLNQSSAGQGDCSASPRVRSVAASARSEAVADYPAGALERRKVKLNIEMPEPPRSRMPRYLRAHYGPDAGNEALKQETRPTPVDMEE
jgi:hypothetical protein